MFSMTQGEPVDVIEKVEDLLGKTLLAVKNVNNEQLVFVLREGIYHLYHAED